MDNYKDIINRLKKDILTACYETKEGHVASAYSILDVLYVLYKNILRYNKDDMEEDRRDRFILSKGHAAIGYYAVLKEAGIINEDLNKMCRYGSMLGGHPDCNKIPGVEASTGSLGHGVPIAVGMALGLKIQKSSSHVYVLAGDGEINEGSVWESIMIAKQHYLNNFTLMIDYNHSTDRAVDMENLSDKLTAFGFCVQEINGHIPEQIEAALKKHEKGPYAIIINTIKGKGIKEMENNPAWHHRIPTEEEYSKFMEELS